MLKNFQNKTFFQKKLIYNYERINWKIFVFKKSPSWKIIQLIIKLLTDDRCFLTAY